MLSRALRRYWALALIVTLASLVATTAYAFRLPSRYTSTAVVSLGPRVDSTASAALVALLATKYVSFAASDQLTGEVADRLGLDDDVVRSGLTVTMPERTTNVTVSVTLDEADSAVDVASAVSGQIMSRVESDPVLRADLVAQADRTSIEEGTGRSWLLLAGAAASVLFGVVVAVLADLLTRQPARRRADAPDLAPPPAAVDQDR
jgi:capsular polysaccharide biosynthesis protein